MNTLFQTTKIILKTFSSSNLSTLETNFYNYVNDGENIKVDFVPVKNTITSLQKSQVDKTKSMIESFINEKSFKVKDTDIIDIQYTQSGGTYTIFLLHKYSEPIDTYEIDFGG